MDFLEIILLIMLAVVSFIMGYLIRFKKKLFLIAGYNKNTKDDIKEEDKEILAKLIGNFTFGVGALLLCLPILVRYLGGIVGSSVFVIIITAGIAYVFHKKPE